MESLVKCASCGKVPRQLAKEERGEWNESTTVDSTAGQKPQTEAKEEGAAPAAKSAGSEADQLQEIFTLYCNRAPKSDAFDNAKWAKCLGDLWLDDKLNKTDGDLIFTKVKPKGGRKLEYAAFVAGVHEVAKKKYGSDDVGQPLRNTNLAKGGADAASGSNVVDRLTNTATYTGSHKQRFDEEGKGKGVEGRDVIAPTDKLIVGKVPPGGKRINLAESLREDVDGSAKTATHCPQCHAPKKQDQRSCVRCGKQFF